MDRWSEFELFVQTAELGSLSRAAEALGMSNAAASRGLVSLENRLNARLVERNTRRLGLTQAGEIFYRRCKSILADMKEAEATTSATTVVASGTLRITGSLSFCMKHIAPLLPEFTRRYPQINVQLDAANRYFDLIESGIDIAIRTKEYESDSNITVRKLAWTRRILAASPAYLARNGTPTRLEELSAHKLLTYTHANNPSELHLSRDGKTRIVKVQSLLEANDGQILRSAALEGLGILVQPNYIVFDDVVAGRLVPVLDDWDLPRLAINIAYQNRSHLPARTRVFIDFIVQHFQDMDFERKWTAKFAN
ncbi:LysR family transcriptional regulator [Undibacterium terreum]|uniref:Transcriptional regulator n=1 Tax=Undibacterium terreum TaxID=1224302 RepID=A0A916XNV2_9BURK|nr:LysR family transcriptional regulator [Undibacterium terreum]GGC90942.1 transcriptional regulator [Undibacterium terreum]